MKKILLLAMLVFTVMIGFSTVNSRVLANEYNQSMKELQLEQSKKLSKFSKVWSKEKWKKSFTEGFGGAFFINEEFYVNVVVDHEEEFLKKYKLDEDFNINIVKYSVRELDAVKEDLMTYWDELYISKISVDEKNNRVEIMTDIIDTGRLKQDLENIYGYDMFFIESTDEAYVTMGTTYVVNGDDYQIGGYSCTVGFAAKNSDGDPGFVSAGHCADSANASNGTNVYMNDKHVGDMRNWTFEEDGNVDAAFIELRDPWIGTTYLPTKDLIFGSSYTGLASPSQYVAVGTNLTFHGLFNGTTDSCNAVEEYGEIIDTNVSERVSGVLINELVVTDIVTHPGDSGGPFTFWMYAGSATSYNMVMGVLSGGNSYESVFTTVTNIMNELNLSAY